MKGTLLILLVAVAIVAAACTPASEPTSTTGFTTTTTAAVSVGQPTTTLPGIDTSLERVHISQLRRTLNGRQLRSGFIGFTPEDLTDVIELVSKSKLGASKSIVLFDDAEYLLEILDDPDGYSNSFGTYVRQYRGVTDNVDFFFTLYSDVATGNERVAGLIRDGNTGERFELRTVMRDDGTETMYVFQIDPSMNEGLDFFYSTRENVEEWACDEIDRLDERGLTPEQFVSVFPVGSSGSYYAPISSLSDMVLGFAFCDEDNDYGAAVARVLGSLESQPPQPAGDERAQPPNTTTTTESPAAVIPDRPSIAVSNIESQLFTVEWRGAVIRERLTAYSPSGLWDLLTEAESSGADSITLDIFDDLQRTFVSPFVMVAWEDEYLLPTTTFRTDPFDLVISWYTDSSTGKRRIAGVFNSDYYYDRSYELRTVILPDGSEGIYVWELDTTQGEWGYPRDMYNNLEALNAWACRELDVAASQGWTAEEYATRFPVRSSGEPALPTRLSYELARAFASCGDNEYALDVVWALTIGPTR